MGREQELKELCLAFWGHPCGVEVWFYLAEPIDLGVTLILNGVTRLHKKCSSGAVLPAQNGCPELTNVVCLHFNVNILSHEYTVNALFLAKRKAQFIAVVGPNYYASPWLSRVIVALELALARKIAKISLRLPGA